MRTVNYRDAVLYAVVYLLGLRPSFLLPEKAATLTNFINRRLELYYDRADWPEWTTTEQRTPDPSHIVAWEQAGQTAIGRVFRVYLRDPAAVRSGALDTPFRLTPAGVYVGLEHGSNVWLKFLPRPQSWTATLWSNAAKAAGETVYDPTSGECYQSIGAQAAPAAAVTDPTKWTKLQFPFALAAPVRRGAYADALRDDGQNDKAAAEDAMAERLFALAAGVLAKESVDLLTDQETPAPRYNSPVTTGAAAGT